jgi:transcription antitermination factor NusG
MQNNMHATLSQLVEPHEFIYSGPCEWIALFSQPGKERAACVWLKRRQYKPYWPRYKGRVKLNRHRNAVRWRSVIPGYIFLPIIREQDRNWNLIQQTPGIHGRMNNSEGGPKILSPTHILEIQRIEAALNSSVINAEAGIPYRIGQRVRVMNDLYWQLEGPVLAVNKNRTVLVEVPFLGRKTRMSLPVAELEAV